MFELIRLLSQDALKDEILKWRYTRGVSPKTLAYKALNEGEEVGLLILEDWGGSDLYIYEIFVIKRYRKCGAGAWLLDAAEEIAINLGRKSVTLEVRSLDRDEMSDKQLIAWYASKGYVLKGVGGSKMTKISRGG